MIDDPRIQYEQRQAQLVQRLVQRLNVARLQRLSLFDQVVQWHFQALVAFNLRRCWRYVGALNRAAASISLPDIDVSITGFEVAEIDLIISSATVEEGPTTNSYVFPNEKRLSRSGNSREFAT